MAEKTIGLRIQLNGINAVVKDIKTFEDEIIKARQDLKQVEIGSKIFNQLSQEIGLAESQLLGLITSTKRLTKEREIEGIGKLGQGIASSFAAATAAVSLFGNKSEDVQKAAMAAQNLLTLALSARGIAEIKLGAQLVARTIAERSASAANALEKTILDNTTTSLNANTAASVTNTVATEEGAAATGIAAVITNGFNATLKSLYTTLAANPYGAIIAVLGLLVSAYLAFGGATEEQVKKQKTLNELMLESANAAQSELLKIKVLTEIIKDNTSTQNERLGAYRELQKLVPELANLTLEEAEAQNILNDAITREITLIELRAKQKALEGFIVQEEEKNIKKQQAAKDQYIKSLRVEIGQLEQFLYQQGLNSKEVAKQVSILIQQKLATQDFKGVSEQLYDVTKQIVGIEEEQNKTLEKTKKSTKDATKDTKDRTDEIKAYGDALKQIINLESERLINEFKLGDFEPFIIKTLQDRKSQQDKLIESTNKLKTAQELLNEVNSTIGTEKNTVGEYYNTILVGTNKLTDSINSLSAAEEGRGNKVKNLLNDYREQIIKLAETPGLQETYKKEFMEIGRLVENSVNELEKVLRISPQFNIKEWESALEDFALKEGDILFDPQQRKQEDRIKALINAEKRYNDVRIEFLKKYNEQKQIENSEDIKRLTNIINSTATSEKDRVSASTQLKEINTQIEQSGNKIFDNLYKNTVQFKIMKNAVSEVNIEANKLNKVLGGNQELANLGVLVDNAEELAKQYSGFFNSSLETRALLSDLQDKLRKKDFSQDEKYGKLLMALNIKLADELYYIDSEGKKQQINISKLSYEEQLALLETFLTAEVDATDKAEKTKQQKTQDTLNGIMRGIQMFSSFVGEASSLYQQKISFELAQLEKSSKATLEQVVGDTEQANTKRLELTKQYETQKAALEKEALIKSLQAQKVQAISALALALLQTYKDFGFTPPGFIAAGIGTALAGYQIALIQDQINAAQSMAGGGMIFGLPHEMGGVNAAGGINLEGGESVINRVSTVKYQSLLSNVNQMGGGKPIINNAQNGLMEERLLQAIAKTNNEPIRAYVLNSDITSGQAINRRLSQLATI